MSDDRNVEMANLTIYSAVGKVQGGISRNTSSLSILDIISDIDTGLSRETKLRDESGATERAGRLEELKRVADCKLVLRISLFYLEDESVKNTVMSNVSTHLTR